VRRRQAALRWLDRQRPDIVLLDVTMPGPNGFEVLKRLRTGSAVPVLMLTARDDQVDRILGFEFGADNYVTKPFNARELVARMNGILRRAQGGSPPGAPEVLRIGQLVLETGLHRATVADAPFELTDAEYRVLELPVLLGHFRPQLVELLGGSARSRAASRDPVAPAVTRALLGEDPLDRELRSERERRESQ
jgi:DNA-binding response OmpR family regulator